MTERFLICVDLDNDLNHPPAGGLDLITISYFGRVFIDAQDSESALHFLKTHFGEFSIYCNAVLLQRTADVIALLDNGAAKVFVSVQQLRAIIEGHFLEDLGRLVLCVDGVSDDRDPELMVKDIDTQLQSVIQNDRVDIYVGGHVHNGKLLDLVSDLKKRPQSYLRRYINFSDHVEEDYVKAITGGHIPIIPARILTVMPEKFPNLLPADFPITSALQTDRPDRLYATIVSDERGVCLGLVYSNEESIRKALESGAGVYYSRSRNGLWIKGETSGDTQELIGIDLDCDGDALRFTVRQKGNGRIVVPCTYSSWLKRHRILPSADCNMFWSLLWSLTIGADTAGS